MPTRGEPFLSSEHPEHPEITFGLRLTRQTGAPHTTVGVWSGPLAGRGFSGNLVMRNEEAEAFCKLLGINPEGVSGEPSHAH